MPDVVNYFSLGGRENFYEGRPGTRLLGGELKRRIFSLCSVRLFLSVIGPFSPIRNLVMGY